MRKLLVASRNRGKIEEIRRLLEPLGWEVCSALDYDVPEVEETGRTFAENALLKAGAALKYTGLPSMADDSGLEVDALGGRPGVYSARYGGEGLSDRERLLKLLGEMAQVPYEARTARFVAAVALAFPDGRREVFTGTVEGRILREPRGQGGFGYDPVFLPEGYGQTFAEMSREEKNALSHRGRAVRKALDFLRKEFDR